MEVFLRSAIYFEMEAQTISPWAGGLQQQAMCAVVLSHKAPNALTSLSP